MKKVKEINLKTSSGVTMVALVVTVIVLIILAAVTIQLLIGENGLITRTQEAAVDTRGATVQERVTLWEAEKAVGAERKTIQDFLDSLENEELLKNDERETLESTGEVIIGSKVVKIDLSSQEPVYSLDVVFSPRSKLVSFYSIDRGATWTEMAGNELHLASFSTDVLIYYVFEGGGDTINFSVNGTEAGFTYDFLTTPTIDMSEYTQIKGGCQKITAGKSVDEVWAIMMVS